MKMYIPILLTLSIGFFGCEPLTLTPEVNFAFVVEDLSTGELNETVTVNFMAVRNPGSALGNPKREILESFEVEVGEIQHHIFHPKHNASWNYRLELPEWKPSSHAYLNKDIYSIYSPITTVPVDPIEYDLYSLSIVPSGVIDLRVDDVQAYVNEYDSVYLNLTAGQQRFHHTFILEERKYQIGRQVAHGDYLVNCYAYRDGQVVQSMSLEIELENRQDTLVKIRF